jgi:hypothetical protein
MTENLSVTFEHCGPVKYRDAGEKNICCDMRGCKESGGFYFLYWSMLRDCNSDGDAMDHLFITLCTNHWHMVVEDGRIERETQKRMEKK